MAPFILSSWVEFRRRVVIIAANFRFRNFDFEKRSENEFSAESKCDAMWRDATQYAVHVPQIFAVRINAFPKKPYSYFF